MAATLTSDGELTYATFPIEKVEQTADGNVTVWGKATDETVDSDEQIVDAKFAAKAIDEFFTSGPNIRVQHQANRDPAGVGISYERDGDAHWVKSRIIEPVAKQLVLGGALRAYSVGIARPTIQRDARARGGRITDGMIVEISLVDRPANKNCGIQLVKMADGGLTTKVFGADDVITKNAVEDVQLTLPADVQVGFSPLDLAKIIGRKNGNGSESLQNLITKQVQSGLMSVDEAREAQGLKPWNLPETSTLEKAEAIIEEREYDESFTGKGKLDAATRNALPSSDFVFPDKRKYPIHDKSHARNALSRASGKPEEGKVRAAVAARYPGLGKKAAKKAAAQVAESAIPDLTKPVQKTDSDSDDKTKAMCLGCGAKQNSEHAFCTECGKTMAGSPAVEKNHDFACLGCGKDLDKGERYCPGCGKSNPGHNPMADLKIPSNKAEGSRVADETVVTAEKKKKSKGDRVATKPGQMPGEDSGSYTARKAKKKKGNPFGGKQSPPFGSAAEGSDDDKDDKVLGDSVGPSAPRAGGSMGSAKGTADAPVTSAPKGEGLGGKKSGAIPIDEGTPVSPRKRKRAKDIPTGTQPTDGTRSVPAHGVPGHRSAAEDQVFDRMSSKVFSEDPEVGANLKNKSLGVSQEDGFLHDLACPAYSWQDVQEAYPDGLAGFSAKSWQDKALEIAATAPLAQAKSAVMLGQHAYTLKSASLMDLMEVKNDLYKAFRDANPGPGSFPKPGEICATSFTRPKISSGRAAYSHQYGPPNSAKVPSGQTTASQYHRDYVSSGHASESPANKGEGAPYPHETGVVMNLDYSNIHKQNVLDAMNAMHDHFDRIMPSGVCPFAIQSNDTAQHPVVAAKSDDEPVIEKKVSPDGMSGKQRKKLQKKLTKKVMSGKMPLDQARIRMGKKPKKSPEPLAPQKAAGPDVTKATTAFDASALTKAFAAVLRKSQKQSDKKIADLTRTVNALADQPDPGTQPFKGMALNPIRKSASPAGVQDIASVAERTQMMVLHELEDTARNASDPQQREAAWNQVLKMKGLV